MNLYFRLAALSAAVFVMTIFALVATIFSDPDAPPVRFLNEHGGALLIAEVIATVSIGLLAMTVDRIHILRDRADAAAARVSAPDRDDA